MKSSSAILALVIKNVKYEKQVTYDLIIMT